jgi:hypothetical protein
MTPPGVRHYQAAKHQPNLSATAGTGENIRLEQDAAPGTRQEHSRPRMNADEKGKRRSTATNGWNRFQWSN